MNKPFEGQPLGNETMSPGLSEAKNYYNWIVSGFTPYTGVNILDIGGGNGTHLEPFVFSGVKTTSTDLSEDSVKWMRARFKDYPNFQGISGNIESEAFKARLIENQYDTILCLNVLEHIENDEAALKSMRAILKNTRGHLLLQVPAHQWLYGSLDRQAGHFRRYTLAELKRKAREAGFGITQAYYFNSFGVIPWFINARVLKVEISSMQVGRQILLFDRFIVPFQRWLEKRVKFPFGQSVIVVAKAA